VTIFVGDFGDCPECGDEHVLCCSQCGECGMCCECGANDDQDPETLEEFQEGIL